MSWTNRINAHGYDGINTWDSFSGTTGASGVLTAQNALEGLGGALVSLETGLNPAFVQAASKTSATTGVDVSSVSLAYTSNNVAGNCLILAFGCITFFGGQFKPFLGDMTVTDTQGNNWIPVCLGDNEAYWRIIWMCCPCAGGANTVTIATSLTGSNAFVSYALAIHEYSGIAPVSTSPNGWLANTAFPLGWEIYLPLLGVTAIVTGIGSFPHQTGATMPGPGAWPMATGETPVTDNDITWSYGTRPAPIQTLEGATDLHTTGSVSLTVPDGNAFLFLLSYIDAYEVVGATGGGTPTFPYTPPPGSPPPVTGLPPTFPKTQRGNIDYDQIRAIARTGDGQQLVTFGGGSRTAGDALVWDAKGNAVDGGGATLSNPMSAEGDMIYGGAGGVPTRLAASTAGNLLQTNGAGVPPTWVSSAASYLGPSVQNNYNSSGRALGTVYQNNTGKAMWVGVTAYNSSAVVDIAAFTDASNPPTTDVFDVKLYVAPKPNGVFFVVLPGNYYQVTSAGSTLNTWTEWY